MHYECCKYLCKCGVISFSGTSCLNKKGKAYFVYISIFSFYGSSMLWTLPLHKQVSPEDMNNLKLYTIKLMLQCFSSIWQHVQPTLSLSSSYFVQWMCSSGCPCEAHRYWHTYYALGVKAFSVMTIQNKPNINFALNSVNVASQQVTNAYGNK